MNVKLDPDFFKKLKKLDVRIRKSFTEKVVLFAKNPNDLELNNHLLKKPYSGLRSINITSDWRAIYQEKSTNGEIVAFFILIGTHQQLYKKQISDS